MSAALILSFVCLFTSLQAQNLTKPTSAHLKFYQDNIGAMVTFNMQTFIQPSKRKCCNTWNPSVFNPFLLNTDIWVQAAQSFGAHYVVFVVDHFSGFSLYPTTAHNYSVKYSSWNNGTGNVIKNFVESAPKYNIRPAFFYSTHENWYYNVSNFNLSNQTLQQQFDTMALTQLNEIANIYQSFGPKYVAEIWFDAGVRQALSFVNSVQSFVINKLGTNATCHSCQNMPDTNVIYWMGNEQAVMPYPNWGANSMDCAHINGDPYGVRWCAPHCDAVLREHIWFWQPNPPPISSTSNLIMKYLTSVGRSCNLILNIAPNMTGLLIEDDINAYKMFGETINLMFNNNGSLLVNVSNPILNGNNLSVDIKVENNITLGIGCVELMEDITNGQIIEKHLIEIYSVIENKWYVLTNSGNSLTVGHKRIQTYNVTDLQVNVNVLRITVLSYVGIQNQALVKLKSIKMFDWTSLSENQLQNLQWNNIIAAGK